MAHIPLRMCVVCRARRPASELMRVVVDKESQTVIPDIHRKSEGRGAYICRDSECIKKAEKRRSFERHLKCAAAEELYRQLEDMI
ncbi:MAG: RNase P modulator RnpM [Candidatus Ornithomonoglobus sp.]